MKKQLKRILRDKKGRFIKGYYNGFGFKKGHKVNLGRKRPDMVGNKFGNRFKKGYTSWNRGKELSEAIKKNMSKAVKERYEGGEIFGFQKGKNHFNWQGGVAYEPCPFKWNDIKKEIRKRDNNICQICEEEGRCVHHIDYNKKNCNSDNLITLCFHCNSKVNFNRKHWGQYFNERT